MKRSLLTRTLVVAGVTLISIYALIGLPFSKQEAVANWRLNIRLGADLQGGMQLTPEVAWREAWVGQGVAHADFPRTRHAPDARGDREEGQRTRRLRSHRAVRGATEPRTACWLSFPASTIPRESNESSAPRPCSNGWTCRDGPFAYQRRRIRQTQRSAAARHAASPGSRTARGTCSRLCRWCAARICGTRGSRNRIADGPHLSCLSQDAARRFESDTAANIGRTAAIRARSQNPERSRDRRQYRRHGTDFRRADSR